MLDMGAVGKGLAAGTFVVAYVGPGAGLSAIGAFLAMVAGVFVAIAGFVWYPIKRVIRRWKKPASQGRTGAE